MMRAVCSTTALAVAISLAGCGDPDATSSGRTKVAVQLNWVPEPEFGGFWRAQLVCRFDRARL